MDVHYKTYASRSSRDIRFNQLLRTKPLSTCSSSSPTAFSKSSISVSPRKRVNVVSFVPTGEGQELITRSPEKIVSENQDNTTSGATQIAVPSQSYTPHSVTEVVVTNSQTVSSAGYKEYSNRPANTSTADNSRNRPPGYTFSRSPIRCTNPKFDQSQQDVALAPASTPSSHVTTVHCISSYPQMNIISYRSQPVSCPAKPATHPKLQSIDKSQVTPAVTVSNSQLKTYNCTDIPKSSRDRIFLNACSVATSETMDSSIFSVSKSSSRPLLTGKNKRAAYNPRSWQKDIETEDSSPTKLQRMSEPFLCQFSTSPSDSQLDTKESSALTSQQNPETCMDYKKSGSNELDDFAFHDCEEEITKNCGTLRPTSCSSKTLTKCRRKSDEEDEDVEEDDVKPWFRPASRDKVSAASGEKLSGNSKKIKVSKSEKSLYTVLHKVKEAYVCQEQGETQDLLDDVEYLVDGLADRNQVNTRALSVLTLANKCLAASFRYTLIAHGLLKRICAKLHDAYKDYTLALTSAGLLFVLSRDRDPNILDVDSLAIVLKLFSAPDTNSNGTGSVFEANRNKEAERVRMRVRQLLDALQQNNAKSLTSTTSNTLDVSNNSNTITSSNQSLFSGGKRSLLPFGSKPPICASLNTRHLQMTRQLTTSDLVIESILNFGTRKAGDWFKAELRNGGGLDRVADAASDAVDYLADLDPANASRRSKTMWRSSTRIDNFALDRLKRVCHYTRLLENMTYMNSDNQTYLVHYRDGILVNRLLTCLRVCMSHLPISGSTNQLNCNPVDVKTTVNSSVGNISSNNNKTQYDSQSILTDCILCTFRFLVNVSHNEFASERLGACSSFLETVFDCLLKLPDRLPATKRFDILVLVLCLLVNMCEHCPENRTRIVYLDITKSCVKQNSPLNQTSGKYIDTYDDEEGEEEEETDSRNIITTSALDELIQLFLTREECARNHDFERDDDEAVAAAARRRSEEESKDYCGDSQLVRPGRPNPTVEEAGLKWRLIEDRRAMGLYNRGCLGRNRRRRCHKQKSKKGIIIERQQNLSDVDEEDEEDSDELDDIDNNDEEEDELDDGDEGEEDDEDDDESVGSGADVEFVADTQEEQEKLAKSMSQAQQHMEDSAVAAYAALLLGCILQSSPRYTDRIRSKLPNGQFRPLAIMLAKLLSFLSLTKGVGSSGSESILRIVRILEAQDK